MKIKNLFLKNTNSNDEGFWEQKPQNIQTEVLTDSSVREIIDYFNKYGEISFISQDSMKKKVEFFFTIIINQIKYSETKANLDSIDKKKYYENLLKKTSSNQLTFKDIIGYMGTDRTGVYTVLLEILDIYEAEHPTIIYSRSFYYIKERFTTDWFSPTLIGGIVNLELVKTLLTTDGIVEYKIHNFLRAYKLLTGDETDELTYNRMVQMLMYEKYNNMVIIKKINDIIHTAIPEVVHNDVFIKTLRLIEGGTGRKLLPTYDPDKQDKMDIAFYSLGIINKPLKEQDKALVPGLKLCVAEIEKMGLINETFVNESGKLWLDYLKDNYDNLDDKIFAGGLYKFLRKDLHVCFKNMFKSILDKHPTLHENPHFNYIYDLFAKKYLKSGFVRKFAGDLIFSEEIYDGQDKEKVIQHNILNILHIITGGVVPFDNFVDSYKKNKTDGTAIRLLDFLEQSCPSYIKRDEYKRAKVILHEI